MWAASRSTPSRFWPSAGSISKEVRRPTWWTQVLLAVGVAWGYDEIRALHGDVRASAIAHGLDVLHFDRALHLDWATPLNAWLTRHDAIADVLAGYYFVMHLGMTSLTLVVLWVHGRRYRWHRDALLVMSLVGLVVYWLYPVAPPRLLPGFHDTVRQVLPSAYDLETARANLYAAFPSLHIAWAVWVGIALWSVSRRAWVRAVAISHPTLTTLTVLATGNHYVADITSGVVVAAVAYPLLQLGIPVAEKAAPRLVRVARERRLDLDERRVSQQQSLAADVAAEVDLGLRAFGLSPYGDDPAEPERVVRDPVAGGELRDRTEARAGDSAAVDGSISGPLRRRNVRRAGPAD